MIDTYDTTDAIDAAHQQKETQRTLWRQLVKRHLDAPQRVLDDRVRVGRVAPEFQGWRVQQPPRDEPRIFMRTTSHQRVGAGPERSYQGRRAPLEPALQQQRVLCIHDGPRVV